VLQVRVRLTSAQAGTKRNRAGVSKADGVLSSHELSIQQLPNSPSAASRMTGRTALGPCECYTHPDSSGLPAFLKVYMELECGI
jgi:hypothetical protein